MPQPTDLDLDLVERRRVLDDWAQKRHQIAVLEAEAAEILVAQFDIHDRDVVENGHHREAIYRSMIAEFSAAGRIPKGSMEYAFADARALRDNLPAVRRAFAEGLISAAHVRAIVQCADVVGEAIANGRADAEIMGLYENAVLVVAERETAARTRAHAREVAASLAGETVVDRHRRACGERRVSVTSLDDGLALLTAVLPEWIAVAVQDRLTQMAHAVVRARPTRLPRLDPSVLDGGADAVYDGDVHPADPFSDEFFANAGEAIHSDDGVTFTLDPEDDVEHIGADERTLDEIRADVFSDMLLTADPSAAIGDALGAIQARVQVTVSATTLAGLDDAPAQLDGIGALDPDIARALAGRNNGWTRLFTDPTGLVVETDTYTPSTAMKRFLRARDQRCRFPGCRTPVQRCQIDHHHDHALGGATRTDNLAHFCSAHHPLKHPDVPERSRWYAWQLPDGTVTWHSPLGREYLDPLPRRVMFV